MDKPADAIFKAVNRRTGEVVWITDLYWFEENGVHDLGGEGHDGAWDLTYAGPLPASARYLI